MTVEPIGTEELHDFLGQIGQCLTRAEAINEKGGGDYIPAEVHHLQMAHKYLERIIKEHDDSDVKVKK